MLKTAIGIFIAALIAELMGTPAMAADMAQPLYKGPQPLPAPAFSWSGFYVGVFGGYGWVSSDWTLAQQSPPTGFTLNGTEQRLRPSGALGGIELGADQQISNWVVGIGADLSLIDSDASNTILLPGTLTFAMARSQVNWLATVTGRAGYAIDRSLFYVKGGLAGAEFKDTYSLTDVLGGFVNFGNQTNTRVGWTVGAGYEYAVFDHWTVKLEYDYMGFGAKDETFTATSGGVDVGWDQSIKRTLQIAKAGVGYKF